MTHTCCKCGLLFDHADEAFFVSKIGGSPACQLCFAMVGAINLGFPKLRKAQDEYEAEQSRIRKMITGDGYI